ncbi:DUF58 domain-containing protein [Neomegalonema perideroedes]|uniref:DUF58 domain-containing protein n=1 Tax=Neomegalonema perideroedes TaxID=217219 RepID=UPI00035FCCE4|nr:DUF58 domain-containing protein [Neomegalonema perideroedes]
MSGLTEVSAEALMALRGRALAGRREAPALARRPGSAPARPRGQGHEIRELRPYVEGDDPRWIDAAATARSGAPQVRAFHEDRDRALTLIADFRRPMLWGVARFRSVAAAEALMIEAWRALEEGGTVAAAALTEAGLLWRAPAGRARGAALVAGFLERAHASALAASALTEGSARELAPDLLRAARLAPRGASLLLASAFDRPGASLDAAFGEIRRRGPLRVLLATEDFERAPPTGLLPYLDEAGEAGFGRFDGLPARLAALKSSLERQGLQVSEIGGPDGAA